MPEKNQRLYQWLLKRASGSQTGKIRADRVLNGLATDLGLDPISIRRELHSLRQDGKVEYTSTPAGEPVSPFITVIKPLVVEPAHVMRWRDVLESARGLTDRDKVALADCGADLDGFSKGDMGVLLDGLLRLREDKKRLEGQPAYLVSARYLLGSSKLLSQIGSRALSAFGIDVSRFPNHPPYVVVGGCADPEMVVLVENPASFELAIKTDAFNRCAFIATYGFGFSKQNDDHGKQLAELARTGFVESITLVRQGSNCPPATTLLTHSNIVFWGDLDIAGMQIFERIASKISRVQLSALYEPMIRAIQHPEQRHPYAAATGSGKPGQKLVPSHRQDVQNMLSYCQRYAVDQEIVLPEEIELLATQALDMSALAKVTPPA